MRSIQVLDGYFDSVYEERYDIALFASGYESSVVRLTLLYIW